MIPVFYRPEQSCDEASSYSPSAEKPAKVVADWLSNPAIASHLAIQSFDAAAAQALYAAHSKDYVHGVLSSQRVNGFGTKSPGIAASLRYTTGSMMAAAVRVLTHKVAGLNVAVSPTSGFHHAGYFDGGAFCTFNGLMASAIHVHTLGLARRILIVDMDQHYGDGTDDIIEKLGIDYVDRITARKSYQTAAQVLQCAELRSVQPGQYDLVLYQAGADMHVNDPLGGLLTTEQMQQRDRAVFSSCARLGIPIAWNLAGGYQRDAEGGIEPVLALHRNTMLECILCQSESLAGTSRGALVNASNAVETSEKSALPGNQSDTTELAQAILLEPFPWDLPAHWHNFANALRKTLAHMAQDQYLILQCKGSNRFVQFATQHKNIRIEASSNHYLSGRDALSKKDIRVLLQLGWKEPTGTPEQSTPERDPDGSSNFFLELPLNNNFTRLTTLAIKTLSEVMGVPHVEYLAYNAFGVSGGDVGCDSK